VGPSELRFAALYLSGGVASSRGTSLEVSRMSSQQFSDRAANAHGQGSVASTSARPDQDFAQIVQRLVDQVAAFNLYATPDPQGPNAAVQMPGGSRGVIGICASEFLHRFDIVLNRPSSAMGVKASNSVGEVAGRLDLRWMVIPYEFMARPDREPPPTLLDWSRSQRFAMQEMTFRFANGRDGFSSFGTGRTFPMSVAGRLKLVISAVGNIIEGFGVFRGHEGNFTLCGDLAPDRGFAGHIVVRVVDQQGDIRTEAQLPSSQTISQPDGEATFLMWGAQKGKGPEQQNRFSLTTEGQVRGLNIPVELKELSIGPATQGAGGLRSGDIKTGDVIGKEIGFGRGSIPAAPQTGTALSPFQFEGVAQYSFYDEHGKPVGSITTNVLEGRRFGVTLAGAPNETSWRFGFFGPIVLGTGCFSGAAGIFYGASGSVFRPPPEHHIVTHLYMARINDPDGKFRVSVSQVRQHGT